jgi:hypothetical protein
LGARIKWIQDSKQTLKETNADGLLTGPKLWRVSYNFVDDAYCVGEVRKNWICFSVMGFNCIKTLVVSGVFGERLGMIIA